MEKYIKKITELNLDKLRLGIKLPPYFDPIHFQYVSDIILKYPKIRFITTIPK